MQRLSEMFSHAPLLTPPVGCSERVLERLARRETRRKAFGALVLLAGAGALALVVMFLMMASLAWLWQVGAHPSLLNRLLVSFGQTLEAVGPLCKATWLLGATLGLPAGFALMLLYILGLSAPTALWLRLVRRAWGQA